VARLSKKDWNKLKKVMGNYKGTLQRGVKWTTGRERRGWTKKVAAKTNGAAEH